MACYLKHEGTGQESVKNRFRTPNPLVPTCCCQLKMIGLEVQIFLVLLPVTNGSAGDSIYLNITMNG